jgi:hypothetical protein
VKTESKGKIMLHHIRRWFNNLWISGIGKSSADICTIFTATEGELEWSKYAFIF